MRYIESLNSESNSFCDWKKELSSTQEIFQSRTSFEDEEEEESELSWMDSIFVKDESSSGLNNNNNNNTLFALRDFMLQETLSVVKLA